ncbi:transcriptional regulator [Candidatus Thorarchaeota archaeon]|nr:MAG: transcriptional regulator [Candidatus Thorarchaeota archaeon]
MPDDEYVMSLRNEIEELRKTVRSLRKTVADLATQLESRDAYEETHPPGYSVSDDVRSCLDQDVSWARLVGLVEDSRRGLTTTELAERWGKSRSRTSEVLNRLVEEGHLVKYRDGRRVKFRPAED